MATEWFYKRDGKQIGPVSSAQIRALAADGTLGPDSLLRKGDTDAWFKAAKIKALFPDETEEPQQDPLIAMGATAAASVANAAGNAASAIGGFFAKKDAPPPTPRADSQWSHLATDGQSVDVLDKLMGKLSGILMADEQVRYVAIQAKPMVIAQDCIALTTKRFIFYRPKLLGRADFEDFVWRELRDAKLSENLIGATVTMQSASGNTLSMDYLPKQQARQVYRVAQEMEERSLEERRSRAMEEKRAASGAVVVHSQPAVAPPAPTADGPMTKLKALKDMADAGLISAAEYEAKKAEILSRM